MNITISLPDDEILEAAKASMQSDLPDEVPERLVALVSDVISSFMLAEPLRTGLVRYMGEMLAAVVDLGEGNPELPAYIHAITERFVEAMGGGGAA